MIKKVLIKIPSFFFKKLNLFKNSLFLDRVQKFLIHKFPWFLASLLGIALADLSILFFFPLPEKNLNPSQIERVEGPLQNQRLSASYVDSFNFFHRGEIPQPFISKSLSLDSSFQENSSQSRLPYTLLGTVVSFDPSLSMASIMNTSIQESQSYFVGDIVDQMAQIISIERRKVTFLNLRTNRTEHIEIPLDEQMLSISNPFNTSPIESTPPENKSNYPGIDKTGENQYSISRSTTNDHLKNLGDILQQARVVPKYSQDGQIIGHTFSWIKKGSVYEGLGFQEGDTIISVNGELPGQEDEATDLFQRLRTTSQFNIVIENENGDVNQVSYDIREDASIQ